MQKTEFIIKPGFFEKKRFGAKQPGLDVTRTIFDVLKNQSLVTTSDCCTYYPTFPVIEVANISVPTEAELKGVPNRSVVILKQGTTEKTVVIYRNTNGTLASEVVLGTND